MTSPKSIALAFALSATSIHAFVPSEGRTTSNTRRYRLARQQHLSASVPRPVSSGSIMLTDHREESFLLTDEKVKPLIRMGSGDKEKVVNAFGLWCAAVSILTGPIWAAAMTLMNLLSKLNKDFDPDRALYDKTGKIWSKTWLTLTGSFPTFSGDIEQLKGHKGPCLYVANHASWLDIPVLCTVLDPVFKFIAKGELRKVPCIGQQLAGGNHILIDREDRRSQLRTFKEGIGWLKKGVPIMAFPEGMRSRDGRLMEFKGGLFSMAVKTKVPIVPISISHAHAVMPGNSLFPVQRGAGKLHVHIHDPIDTSDKKEAELGELVRVSFLSQLPFDQHPLALEADQDIIVESKRVEKHSVQVTSIADVSLQPTVATKESSEHSNIESAKATP